jgi:hypothetical protein
LTYNKFSARAKMHSELGDTGAMEVYEDQVVPRLTELVMSRRELPPIRARVTASLDGDVLEVGFGSGLNVPHYPPAVTQVRAVDPATVRLYVRRSRDAYENRLGTRTDRHRRRMQ